MGGNKTANELSPLAWPPAGSEKGLQGMDSNEVSPLRQTTAKHIPRPLLGITEGVNAERLATLGNLARVVRASKTATAVLIDFYEAGATDHPVPAHAETMARRYDAHVSTIRRAYKFWRDLRVLNFEERFEDSGNQLPSDVRIDWDSIRRILWPHDASTPSHFAGTPSHFASTPSQNARGM